MGLNLSNQQIAQELSLHKDEVHQMTGELRQAVADKRPEVQLSGTVEFDEVYVTAGHKGQPEAVKKKGSGTAAQAQRISETRYTQKREAADLRDDSAWRRRGHQNAGECSTADHQTDYSGKSKRWDAHLHRRVRHLCPT